MPLLNNARTAAVAFESWWFDMRHKIDTRANKQDRRGALGDLRAGFWYLPTRPATARQLLRALPISDHSSYTFIDIGSGKGRMLFLAAEYPFQKIYGIEMRKELHERAVQNLSNLDTSKLKCPQIECLNLNALDYEFPNGNLVVYLFNPFGWELTQKVLRRLVESMDRQPEDVLLVMSFPESASAVDAMPQFQLCGELRNCSMYRSRSERS